MTLSILYTENHRTLSLAAILDVFDSVNRFLLEDNKLAAFDIQLVGIDEKRSIPETFSSYPYFGIQDADAKKGVIIVPAFKDYDMAKNLELNAPLIPWLSQSYQQGSKLLSCCTGVFLLGASGLLNGKDATTHLDACPAFSVVFPEVNLIPEAVITCQENIYTSGGATSMFHILIYLIQETCGREYALKIAKNFSIDMDRNNQLYFEKFRPSIVSEDKLVQQVQKVINERFKELKNVEDALEEIPSSRRNIVRRFKTATGMTPIRYLQKTKIESAKTMLETTNKDILEIMISSGYQDVKSFRELFKNITGLTPKGYREKYAMGLQA
jgi:transcriptional regulator GlxA family with amidase domain